MAQLKQEQQELKADTQKLLEITKLDEDEKAYLGRERQRILTEHKVAEQRILQKIAGLQAK